MVFLALWLAAASLAGLETARNRQDRAALDRLSAEFAAAAAAQPNDAGAQYRAALAYSYLAAVTMEMKDKGGSRRAAEAGIPAAEKAVALAGNVAEHHRILGTLCGQVIPANVIAGLKYGRCALDRINKAIELDPKSAAAHLSRGVGNFYLPPAFGGGMEVAIGDFQKALQLDPKLSEAHLWLGIALRELNRNAEARQSLSRAVQLNPDRVWAKQQLEKTPAK